MTHKRNTGPMTTSLRCGAKTRADKPCAGPAVRGKKRCRMHGGARGSGGQPGNLNAFKHGKTTAQVLRIKAYYRGVMRDARKILRSPSNE